MPAYCLTTTPPNIFFHDRPFGALALLILAALLAGAGWKLAAPFFSASFHEHGTKMVS